MAKIMNNFNNKLALIITKAVSTVWCAYIFAILALIALPSAIKGGTLALVQWLSQTFIQLVMLSLIMVGQNLMSEQVKKHHKEHMKHLKQLKKD